MSAARRRGLLAASSAFAIWGALPLYLQPLRTVSSLQLIAHRIVWSCGFVLAWIALRGELRAFGRSFRDGRLLARLALSAFLISCNWLIYVWAATHGHVVEASLGYFVGPLVNVLLGVSLLSERLSRAQWLAVGLAALGVAYLGVAGGTVPWIALGLALSFASYGFVRKIIAIEALHGLATETVILAPLAGGYLAWCEWTGTSAFGHSDWIHAALLVGCGPLTAVPLVLFAVGARLLPYSLVGVLQYITPSLQFLCGVLLLQEPFSGVRALGFGIIWIALMVYSVGGPHRLRTGVVD